MSSILDVLKKISSMLFTTLEIDVAFSHESVLREKIGEKNEKGSDLLGERLHPGGCGQGAGNRPGVPPGRDHSWPHLRVRDGNPGRILYRPARAGWWYVLGRRDLAGEGGSPYQSDLVGGVAAHQILDLKGIQVARRRILRIEAPVALCNPGPFRFFFLFLKFPITYDERICKAFFFSNFFYSEYDILFITVPGSGSVKFFHKM